MKKEYIYRYKNGKKFKLIFDKEGNLDEIDTISIHEVRDLITEETKSIAITFNGCEEDDNYIDNDTLILIENLLENESSIDIDFEIEYEFEGIKKENHVIIGLYESDINDSNIEFIESMDVMDGELTYKLILDDETVIVTKEVFNKLYSLYQELN